jgi:hypothetical protein
MMSDSRRKAPKIKTPLKWDQKAYQYVVDALTLTCISSKVDADELGVGTNHGWTSTEDYGVDWSVAK